jgi:hypothetical protein
LFLCSHLTSSKCFGKKILKKLVLGKSPKLGQLWLANYGWPIFSTFWLGQSLAAGPYFGWANFAGQVLWLGLWLGHRLAQPKIWPSHNWPSQIFFKCWLGHSLTGPKMAAAGPAKWAFPQHYKKCTKNFIRHFRKHRKCKQHLSGNSIYKSNTLTYLN